MAAPVRLVKLKCPRCSARPRVRRGWCREYGGLRQHFPLENRSVRLSRHVLRFFPSQLKSHDVIHKLSFFTREIIIATRVDSPLESIWRHLTGHSNCILHFSAGRRKLFRSVFGSVIARRGGRSTVWVGRRSRHRCPDAGAPCTHVRGALRSGSCRRFHRDAIAGLGARTWRGRVAVVRV